MKNRFENKKFPFFFRERAEDSLSRETYYLTEISSSIFLGDVVMKGVDSSRVGADLSPKC